MKSDPHSSNVSIPQERYIEVLGQCRAERCTVGVSEIATRLGVSAPSASEALKRLVSKGLVLRVSRFEVALSKEGNAVYKDLTRRESRLLRFLINILAMEPADAGPLACKLEHAVDAGLTRRIGELTDFLEAASPEFLNALRTHLKHHG